MSALRTWKGWDHDARMASYQKTLEAVKKGIIPYPTAIGCQYCGQKKGIIQYHNQDYSDPIKHLVALCWRCHMVLHSEHFASGPCGQYWADIRTGHIYPAVYRHAFRILGRDHHINKRGAVK